MRWRLLGNTAQLTTPITASTQVHGSRTHLFLEIEHEGVVGYGEISPQPQAINGDAGFEEIVAEWNEFLAPSLDEIVKREKTLPQWFRASRISGPRSSANFAAALLEMALLDWELRNNSLELTSEWQERFDTPEQFTSSALGQGSSTIPATAHRLRLKVGPDSTCANVLEIIGSDSLPVLLDYNCSASSIGEVASLVSDLGELVVAVEQPFAPGNFVDHALLAKEIWCHVSLDEGLRSLTDLQLAARHDAASLVCVKPARVGGFANARAIVQKASELGIKSYVGGYFESPLARTANRVFARNVTNEPSDIGTVAIENYSEVFDLDDNGIGVRPSAEFLNRCSVIATSTISL